MGLRTHGYRAKHWSLTVNRVLLPQGLCGSVPISVKKILASFAAESLLLLGKGGLRRYPAFSHVSPSPREAPHMFGGMERALQNIKQQHKYLNPASSAAIKTDSKNNH